MYSLATCPTCVEARRVLNERGAEFEDRVVDDRPDWEQEAIRISGQYTVPVFVHSDGRVEVGFEGEYG